MMKWIVLVWGIACVAQASPELDRVFTHYETRELHLDQMASSAAVTHRLNIDIAGKSREMILEPVNLRSPSLAASHGWTYRGTVVGEPGSDVRLLVNDRLLLGYVRTADGFVFIDPVYIYARGEPPDHVVMYREEDVRPEFRSRCGGALKAPVGARSFAAVAVSAPTELRQVEVATDADAEFFQLHGDMSNAFIEGILNVVDGVYSSELGLSLEIVFQNVFTNAATQPYASTDASQLLTEFQDEWNAHRNGVARDVAHLFTGKSLDGSTAGIGFLDVVCDAPSFAYALTSSSALMSRVTAHEMGHNFGAKHDDEFVPPTAVCDGTGPLMCSAVQPRGPYDFSQRSIDDIAAHVAADGGCLAVLPTVELSVVISNVPNQVAVGDFITGIVLVSNAGPQEATGVTLTLSVSGAAIDSINSALGDCAPLFNTLSCGPAILPAGSTAESSIVIVPNRAGLVCLNASVVVDQHEMDTTNNRTQRCATAAVYDLAVVKLKAPRKVTLTGSVPSVTGKFSVVIQNRSSVSTIIPDLATLRSLVTVNAQSLGACPDVVATVLPPRAAFPITLAPKKKLSLALTGTFDCPNDPMASTKTDPHPDYRSVAHVNRAALPDGIADAHAADDDCPRTPLGLDANPDGTIQDKGCAEILTDVVRKP